MIRLCLLTALLTLPLWGQGLRVGQAAVKITPPVGIPMAGYYSIRLAEGLHDDLYAKAVVLDDGTRRVGMVACDLINIDDDLVAAARKAAGMEIMVSATHSHTGPLLSKRFLVYADAASRKLAGQYRAALPAKIAEAVRLAEANLQPSTVTAAVGREDSISFYRRFLMKDGTVRFNPGKMNPEIVQPMGEIDPDVGVVRFEPQALFVNFTLHLDTVGGTHFSADYPYTLEKLMRKLHGPSVLTVFTIGAAGNINHVNVKTREPQKGHGEAERIGTVLAGEVLKTLARMKPVAETKVQMSREVVELPVVPVSGEEIAKSKEIAAQFGKQGGPAFLEMVHAMKVLDIAGKKTIPAEVQVISLGKDLAWVALPGEIFVELGTAIKKASPFRQTMIVELANGNISYVPTRKGFVEGAYEAISARCAPGGGEILAETAIRLVAALHREGR